MASHQLIDDHLAALSRALPSETVEELADGLVETWHHYIAAGLAPSVAAQAAIKEFGTPDQITRAFVAQAPGRRIALTLLATGPIIGAAWAASLIAARAWAWPIPLAAKLAFGLTLLSVVATLLTAATSQRNYRRTRLGNGGSLGIIVLDVAMIAGVLLLAPTLAWPMVVAVPASLGRSALTLRSLSNPLAWR
jgi:hypothetical protein